MLTLNEYQELTRTTAIYPGNGTPLGIIYCGLKLAGEAGEVSENIGKAIRDDKLLLMAPATVDVPERIAMDYLTPERREKLILELGDVLWYVAALAKELGRSLEDIADANLRKLADRQQRGVLKGSGDDR